jgi:SAM-dependent methyltransferase
LGLRVSLRRADYRDLARHFETKFDAVVCLSSSIFEMPNNGEALRALRSMRAVLGDGGVLVLSQGTTDSQWRAKPRFILAADTERFSRLFVVDYSKRGARYNVVDILRSARRPEIRVWGIEYPNVILRDGLERLLTRAGFAKVGFYGGYRFQPYSKESSSLLIAVASN